MINEVFCQVFFQNMRLIMLRDFWPGLVIRVGVDTCTAWSRAGNVEFLNRYRRG